MPQRERQRPEAGAEISREMPAADIQIRAVDEQARTVELSFSSETPVARWWGDEILCHDEGSADMARLTDIGVLLFNHASSQVLGKVINAEIDAESHKGRAVVQFDEDPAADLIYQKVLSGTLKGVSVGYRVLVWETVSSNAVSTNGRFKGPVDVATRWEPYEISIVSVPADASVGVGRSAEIEKAGSSEEVRRAADAQNIGEGNRMPNQVREEGAAVQTVAETGTIAVIGAGAGGDVAAERQRAKDIIVLCREFPALGLDPSSFIADEKSVDDVRAAILEQVKQRGAGVQGAPRVDVVTEAVDKFRAAAPHALIMRAGLDIRKAGIEKPHAGAAELRGMGLRSMMEEYLRLQGRNDAARLSPELLIREIFTPDSAFASVLDATIGHAMMVGHNAAGTTYQLWCRIGSNKDFKATPKYRMSEAGEPTKIPQSGEIPFDEMSDQGVSTKVDSYGVRWGFSRQALINDDLGVLTTTPMQYAIAARRKVNAAVYAILNANAAVFDGTALFHADHGNLDTVGAAPNIASIGKGRAAMRKQKGLRSKQALNINPAFLIAGVDVETTAEQVVGSNTDVSQANPGKINPFNGKLVVLADAELTDTNSWHLSADPTAFDTIEVTFLNGVDTPIIESRVGWDVAGMEWRLILDYGVTALDYRGLWKNGGES